jgi:AcrR family transcriptional regulator
MTFSRSGANASLDDIAREAGVGPGTPYRHFLARGELLQAVYWSEMEKVGRRRADVRANHAAASSFASEAVVAR